MSPEWMMAFDIAAMRNDKRGKTLVDPLERAEWQGLDLVSRLFSRWLSTDGRESRRYRPMPHFKPARFHQ